MSGGRQRLFVFLALALLASGCSTLSQAHRPELPKRVPAAAGLVVTRGPEYVYPGSHGEPSLCIGGTTDTNPAKCIEPGVALTHWPKNAQLGTDYLVTGSFDGSTLSVTRIHRWDDERDKLPRTWPFTQDNFRTPCAAPANGWRVLNPSKTTAREAGNLEFAAAKLPGYTAFWWDYSRTPRGGKDNDPNFATANVFVDRDVAGARRTIRRLWGGALCVTRSRHSSAEQQRISSELDRVPGRITISDKRDSIEILVTYDDGMIQRWADKRYGPHYVQITSALQDVSTR